MRLMSEWHYDAILYMSADPRTNPLRPQLLFDISDVIDEKLHACAAHVSQSDRFCQGYSRTLGQMAGVSYAEGLYLGQVLVLDKVSRLVAYLKLSGSKQEPISTVKDMGSCVMLCFVL